MVTLQQGLNALVLGTFKTTLSMHWLAHVFKHPNDWRVCRKLPTACPSSTPVWFVKQNGALMLTLFVPAFCLGSLIYLVEVCCSRGYFVLLVAFVFVYSGVYFLRNVRALKSKSKVA
jgi:hypothetical protein